MIQKISQYLYSNPSCLIGLSNIETRLLRSQLQKKPVKQPVWVSGLARSGTTILIEFLAQTGVFATHQYSDFPFIPIPYFWNKLNLPSNLLASKRKYERSHQDGLKINSQSPESMEEIIWTLLIDNLHTVSRDQRLTPSYNNANFERFYDEHIRKLLHVRNKKRYASKANYNFSRLPYLHKLYPDAKFIIIYRNPETFIASSIKQDKLFCHNQTRDPKQLLHTNTSQHFEFGLNKKPINFGNTTITTDLLAKIESPNQQIEGWAIYWQQAYDYFVTMVSNQPTLKNHICVISYEALCNQPSETLSKISNFIQIEDDSVLAFSKTISTPSYYHPSFTPKQVETIKHITAPTLHQLCTFLH